MAIRIAINGYGRIGRCILRALFESQREKEFNLVAINDLAGINTTAHLTRYDSTHGRFRSEVTIQDQHLLVNQHPIQITAERDPRLLPWKDLDIDLVLECTGRFTQRETAQKHLEAGAKKVLISAPGTQMDATVVYGVNEEILQASDCIVSNASCTTNGLAHLLKPLHEAFGVSYGFLNTVHAYTKDQMLLDGSHSDLRRARAATQSIIPTKTGAAASIGLIIPTLAGKLDGFAMRVPVINVSVIDLTFTTEKACTPEAVNEVMRAAKNSFLAVNEDPLVSCDFNHCPASAVFDATQTKQVGPLMKVVAWYDNEWAFANRMLDTAKYMMNR